jgi:hypothetical protein
MEISVSECFLLILVMQMYPFGSVAVCKQWHLVGYISLVMQCTLFAVAISKSLYASGLYNGE